MALIGEQVYIAPGTAPLVTFEAAVQRLNREIIEYNFKLPPGLTHKFHYYLDKVVSGLLAGM